MPSPAEPNTGTDSGGGGGLEERLGRFGDALWLTSVGAALSLVAVLAFLASAGLLGRVSPYLGAAVLVLGLIGVVYLLFGSRDWSPGGEARQHAAFLVLFVGLQAVGVAALRTFWGLNALHGGPFLILGFAGLAVAGWLAYLGGFERLASLTEWFISGGRHASPVSPCLTPNSARRRSCWSSSPCSPARTCRRRTRTRRCCTSGCRSPSPSASPRPSLTAGVRPTRLVSRCPGPRLDGGRRPRRRYARRDTRARPDRRPRQRA